MAESGGRENGTSNYLVAIRGYWLPAENHLGDFFFSRIHYPQVGGNSIHGDECYCVMAYVIYYKGHIYLVRGS